MTRKLELRKARQDKNNELIELINCKQRFILLKATSKLTRRQAHRLERLCKVNEPIYKAMLLKESFLEIYDCHAAEDAREHLLGWLKDAVSSGLETFKVVAESFSNKMEYIINWFNRKISSAISEGINNKIKRLKRMAYGYRDIDYYQLKIHQHCGLLNPRKFPH